VCSSDLDPDALERAVGLVGASFAAGTDLLIVNKFGKHVADGRGFREVIAEAVAADVPVLVGLNPLNRPAFLAFTGEDVTQLSPNYDALAGWVEQKVERLGALREEIGSGGLAVIGDGVNDAPALATADVGLAMGGVGADAALETADVVILNDDLALVPWSLALARRVRVVMFDNLLFAIAVIAVLAVGTAIGWVPMGAGVVGHEGSTIIVVANSLRLLAHARPAPLV